MDDKEVTDKDLTQAITAEMALFLEESRALIIKRATERLARIFAEKEKNET